MNRPQHLVSFNLAKLMRCNGVTIRDLSQTTGITQKRIREIRAMDRVPFGTFIDLRQAVTGEKPNHSEVVRCRELMEREIF
jgi:hypothetical protein